MGAMPSTELLEAKARWVWEETLRIHRRSTETRVASSLSPIEIFVVLYYGGLLRYYQELTQMPRDLHLQPESCLTSKRASRNRHRNVLPIRRGAGTFPGTDPATVLGANP